METSPNEIATGNPDRHVVRAGAVLLQETGAAFQHAGRA
jgi:hypothetical protein